MLGEVGQEHADRVRVRFFGVLWIGYHWISLCCAKEFGGSWGEGMGGGDIAREQRECVDRMDIPLLVSVAIR